MVRTYNPLLHAHLVDCGCGRILDTRSVEEMEVAITMFCQSKQFDHVFLTYVVFLIHFATQDSQEQLPPVGFFPNSLPPRSFFLPIAQAQINQDLLGTIG